MDLASSTSGCDRLMPLRKQFHPLSKANMTRIDDQAADVL